MRFLSLQMIALALLLGACSDHSCDHLNKDEIKNNLYKHLRVGDSRDKIESVLREAKISSSYDKFETRYQSYIREEGCPYGKDIIIDVYLDNNGRMSRIETMDSYTWF